MDTISAIIAWTRLHARLLAAIRHATTKGRHDLVGHLALTLASICPKQGPDLSAHHDLDGCLAGAESVLEDLSVSAPHVKALLRLGACEDAIEFAAQHPTLQAAWDACPKGEWLLWYLENTLGEAARDTARVAYAAARAAHANARDAIRSLYPVPPVKP